MKTAFAASCFFFISTLVHADAVKYRQANGQVVITNQTYEGDGKQVSVYREEYVSPRDRQAAINDLQRQRDYLNARERESSNPPQHVYTSPNIQQDISQIQRCLSKVTAMTGLSPAQEASRKVNCYSGTQGLNDDCQRSVAATMRLSTRDEQMYKSHCPG